MMEITCCQALKTERKHSRSEQRTTGKGIKLLFTILRDSQKHFGIQFRGLGEKPKRSVNPAPGPSLQSSYLILKTLVEGISQLFTQWLHKYIRTKEH